MGRPSGKSHNEDLESLLSALTDVSQRLSHLVPEQRASITSPLDAGGASSPRERPRQTAGAVPSRFDPGQLLQAGGGVSSEFALMGREAPTPPMAGDHPAMRRASGSGSTLGPKQAPEQMSEAPPQVSRWKRLRQQGIAIAASVSFVGIVGGIALSLQFALQHRDGSSAGTASIEPSRPLEDEQGGSTRPEEKSASATAEPGAASAPGTVAEPIEPKGPEPARAEPNTAQPPSTQAVAEPPPPPPPKAAPAATAETASVPAAPADARGSAAADQIAALPAAPSSMVAAPSNAPPAQPSPAVAPGSAVAEPLSPTPELSPRPPRIQLSADEAAALMLQGDKLFALGDIVAARLYFERAAESGNARALFSTGETFDPRVLARIGVRGNTGDEAKAAYWYQRAAALGDGEARRRLQRLYAAPPK